ncbi:MAG: lamin tail domain-containing protein [Cyclobacteriaceae bacterium]
MMAKNFVRLALSCITLCTLLMLNNCSSDEDKEPNITAAEGLFINEISASGDDWVELYNSTSSQKDISGYRIQDDGDVDYELPDGTTVPANGFLVIYCDDTNTGLHTNFKLSSGGETVTLKNNSGEIAEAVTYPKLDNGQSYGRYPDGSDNFAISGNTSQGSSNDEANAPAITTILRTPTVPALNQEVTIQAELTNTDQLSTVKLYYSFEGADYTSAAMTKVGNYYTAIIPAQGAGVTGTMNYYVEAKSTTGAVSYKPFDAPADSYHYLLNNDALPALHVNEIMASSTTCCPDDDGGVDEFDDWIEIYNSSASTIDLSGMYLSDDLSDPFKSKIPNGVTIPAGGFLLFWADEQGSQGPLHMNFKLSKSGESVGLFYIDGRKISSKDFGAQDDNKSFGASTNGGSTWQQFTSPTPGASNN